MVHPNVNIALNIPAKKSRLETITSRRLYSADCSKKSSIPKPSANRFGSCFKIAVFTCHFFGISANKVAIKANSQQPTVRQHGECFVIGKYH